MLDKIKKTKTKAYQNMLRWLRKYICVEHNSVNASFPCTLAMKRQPYGSVFKMYMFSKVCMT